MRELDLSSSEPNHYHVGIAILNISTLPISAIKIIQAQEWAYDAKGTLRFNCGSCHFPDFQRKVFGCPKVGARGEAIDCEWDTCPGDALQGPEVAEIYQLIRMVGDTPLIYMLNESNILTELAEYMRIESDRKIERSRQDGPPR